MIAEAIEKLMHKPPKEAGQAPHRVVNRGAQTAEVLMVISPPDTF